MLRIAILGCGRIGQVHARALMRMPNVQLVALSDAFPEAAQALATKTGAQIRDTDAILAADDVDAIIICTPTDTHFDLIQSAANAGKAIFCEKPVDLSVERILTCIDVVQSNNVPFLSAFNRRFDPNFALVQSRLAAGDIGNIEMVTIQSRDPNPPPVSYIKSSGGIFRDMMIHDFDMARFLLGEEPVQVFAVGSSLVDPAIGKVGDVDTAATTLTTASGKICQITNSRRATYGYDQRIEVHGSNGMLRAENVLENTVELATAEGFNRAPTKHFFLERYEAAYMAEMTHFIEAVIQGVTPSPSIFDGLKAQQLAEAAAQSLISGEAVSV
ncbi:MAG: inositol 2-dehydrogenase [Sulfitobacter sp.]